MCVGGGRCPDPAAAVRASCLLLLGPSSLMGHPQSPSGQAGPPPSHLKPATLKNAEFPSPPPFLPPSPQLCSHPSPLQACPTLLKLYLHNVFTTDKAVAVITGGAKGRDLDTTTRAFYG